MVPKSKQGFFLTVTPFLVCPLLFFQEQQSLGVNSKAKEPQENCRRLHCFRIEGQRQRSSDFPLFSKNIPNFLPSFLKRAKSLDFLRPFHGPLDSATLKKISEVALTALSCYIINRKKHIQLLFIYIFLIFFFQVSILKFAPQNQTAKKSSCKYGTLPAKNVSEP